jgi:hypothetical protein
METRRSHLRLSSDIPDVPHFADECILMRLVVFLSLAAAVLVSGCWPKVYRTTVSLAADAEMTMSVHAMPGWHSDWYRALRISAPEGTIETDLFEDTGWWRGSNLYVHTSGVYVLHEGQAGCIVFATKPLAFVTDQAISCDRIEPVMISDETGLPDVRAGGTTSRFYRDLRYIGHFAETPRDDEKIRFISADEQPEVELPDVL